jgi:microcompartment protein CcmL/EutN
MLKAANVRLVGIEQTVPALMTVKVVGETAAVRASVDAGAAAAERVGVVVSKHVIPRPSSDVAAVFLEDVAARPEAPPIAGAAAGDPDDDLEEHTVKELRELAREIEDFPLRGREISRATKDELIALLRTS